MTPTCGDSGGRTSSGEPCMRPTDGRCWQHPENTEQNTEGELVVPEHGRGRIWQGASANPAPGPGRPPSRIKQALRKSFDERIPALEAIADDQHGEIRDRLRALDMMAKYSDLDLNVDIELVEKLGAVVASEIADPEAMGRIKEQWLEIVASRIALG